MPVTLTLSVRAFHERGRVVVRAGRAARRADLGGEMLSEIIGLLPMLTGPISDASFFAGLAALLSSHCGLGWNRVLIFQCTGWSATGPSWPTPWVVAGRTATAGSRSGCAATSVT